MSAGSWHADLAWLGQAEGLRDRVLIETEDERIVAVTADRDAPPGAVRLPGLVVPGLANAHSHAFQRALRGRGQDHRQGETGTFWTWRELMYRLAGAIDPDAMHDLARAAYAEMALAGITAVGEFHYLHHDAGGRPYDDLNLMGRVLMAAAAEAGLRLTLLDACYLRGGLDGRPLEGAQLRFSDGSAAAWARRAGALREEPGVRVGAAIHSVRAVDPDAMAEVAGWARAAGAPLHAHVSEQLAENDECLRVTGLTPSGLLARAGALGPGTVAVHATHLTAGDRELLGRSGTGVCLCPTTERDLADGVGPAAALEAAGCPLSLGSDSHAAIDLFEEARAVELDQRLVGGRRGGHAAGALLAAATAGGMAALGWDAGRLAPGRLADLAALDLDSVRLAGWDRESLVAQVVYAAAAADVTDVVVGGRHVVAGGRHLRLGDVGAALRRAVARALSLAAG